MKVLVCGGRDFTDYPFLKRNLDNLHKAWKFTELINGDARGADRLSTKWARETGVPVKLFPANWDEHGNAAGPIRNQQMLKEAKPDTVIAFPGGRGTQDMVSRALKAKVGLIEISKRQ